MKFLDPGNIINPVCTFDQSKYYKGLDCSRHDLTFIMTISSPGLRWFQPGDVCGAVALYGERFMF